MPKKSSSESMEKDIDALQGRIRKLLENSQEDEFEEMKGRTKKIIDESISSLRNEMKRKIDEMEKERVDIASFLAEIKKNRGMIEKVSERLDLLEEPGNKGGISDTSATDDVRKELEKIKYDVRQNTTKNAEAIRNMESELANIMERTNEITSLGNATAGFDIKGMARDIEALKQRTIWLQENIEKLNMQPLLERIREIEEEMRMSRRDPPLVIE